ncbi:hypothetical protein OJF2_32960 [Aquisphaera giovannonii]|uniref:Uncharacterized protein n=1 Tax=Aquisphaera giovannonii TaxID=406548 RepID=A0A5B9W3D7_9BACT|nr:hypothetical protein [Aquisphaera giovannonii]QEH34754.1 hypothetical protein OJF2_32960 [Aquisphaera giovannonii]
MRCRSLRGSVGAMLLGLLALPGCGSSQADSGPQQLTGRVTYNGRALTNQSIVFAPREDLDTNWGFAVTDDGGNFSVSPVARLNKLTAGIYNIYFDRPASTPRFDDGQRRKQQPAAPAVELPDRFYHANQSGLWARVERGSRWIQIDLRDGPKA